MEPRLHYLNLNRDNCLVRESKNAGKVIPNAPTIPGYQKILTDDIQRFINQKHLVLHQPIFIQLRKKKIGTQKMCDVSCIRKVVVILTILACVFAEPQLNLPPYPSSTPSYPNSYSKNDINRNFPYNTQYDSNPQNPQKPQDNYDDRDVFRDNVPRDNPNNFNYNLGYPEQGYSTPRPFNLDGPRNDISGGRDSFDPNNPDDRFKNRSPYRGDIRGMLQALDLQASQQCTANVAAQWNFETNVNEVTQLEALKAQQYYSEFQHGLWDLINHLDNLETVPDPNIYRQLRYYSIVGPAALPPEKLDRYNRLINDMLSVYNSANICAYNEPFRCGLRLQPDLVTIMAKSRNWDELQHVWTEWRRNTGHLIKDSYEQMAQISNDAAKLNNFTNTADYWNFPFESSNLHEDLEDVWQEVKPLYEQLHTYVRRRLREYYGSDKINRQAPLPAHILGNMWAQSWVNIMDITEPYPGQKFLDVTPEMIKQGYAPVDIFRLAEDFFVSMNMTALPLDFWSGSVLQEPLDRVVLCQPSAWDFCNRRDYRIKMCTRVNMKDLITAHHELAHVHYFMQYKNLPKVFRDGANPAFHEAIGEAIGLSVGTPRHLQSLGLVPTSVEDIEVDINFLYSMALDKLPFLPFAYIMDKWRYEIFRKERLKDQYNCNFWRLSEEYMGIKPPVLRSEMDFDPGSKYHIPANIPYLRYFVSTILQFQIYRSMCIAAGQYKPQDPLYPLHKCDIYRSKEAGRILKQLMEKGSSLPWRDILFQATGESRLDGSAMRDYFAPLEEWLRTENLRTREYVGWLYDGDYCKRSIETAGLQVFGGFYNGSNSTTPSLTLLLGAIMMSIIFCRIRV